MRAFDIIFLILKVAFRNLWLYRFKTFIIGGLLGFGAFLGVVGLSLLQDVETSMQSSITGSIAGHIQLYSSKAKDELSLFGSGFMGTPDIGSLTDIVPFRREIMQNANVEAMVPMGMGMAILSRGNEMDDVMDALRSALKGADTAIVQNRTDQIRFQVGELREELAERRKILADQNELDKQEADINKAEAPDFLKDLKLSDEPKLQFLETKIAPLSGEKPPIYLSYLGTDIELYRQHFPKLQIVEGNMLPAGQRGILLSHRVREEQLKNLAARIFDRLHKRVDKAGIAIKGDAENERNAGDLPRQYSRIMSFLDRPKAETLSHQLDELGITSEANKPGNPEKPERLDIITKLIVQLKIFLTVNDQSFGSRYKWFYAHIAPLIKLYEISPGETVTLRSYTRSGYLKSVPLKVYGVYNFAGLEDSDLAGVTNITDLVSFRELYGQMTEISRKELDEMRAQVGIRDVKAEDAEAALFGGSDTQLESRSIAPVQPKSVTETIHVKPVIADTFDPNEVRQGLALNAAIILKDPSKIATTQEEIDSALKAKSLSGKLADWQKASGMVGQFANIMRFVLVFALSVIFLVTLVIINNTIIVSTFNRIREIGTMRAIGAKKTFVVGLFLAETGITGFLGSITGAVFAVCLLLIYRKVGIPAGGNDIVNFLFSGPRLHPTIRWTLIAKAPLIVTIIATLASVYAARFAAHVQPAEAMQEKE